MAWFALNYKTTLNDDRLLDMTLEELLVLFYINRISQTPNIIEQLENTDDSYEEWLKKEMGDSYVSEEEMVQQVVEYEEEELEKAKELPDSISTDFEKLQKELLDDY
jgi:predicted Rossmann-fold nucleotide-binding protein